MLKGLALTPPVIGRISIGRVIEKAGKRLPEKDDEFTITSQVQNRSGWVNHPLNESLRPPAGGKLRSIAVRLMFDDPELNLRASYCLFDRQSGRPLCVGNGQTCRRATVSGIQTLPCLSPEACEMAAGGHCKPYGRMNVRIGDEDELGSFVFRTTGFNSIRTLSARLMYFHALSGGVLSTLPLELKLRGKSTAQSHRAPIFYVDLIVRSGMTLTEAVTHAKTEWTARRDAGFDQTALDAAALKGLAKGAFEESAEEGPAIVEEFFAEPTTSSNAEGSAKQAKGIPIANLAAKLENKAALINATGVPAVAQ